MNRLPVVLFVGASFILAACGSSPTAAKSASSPSPGAGNGFRNGAAGKLVQINSATLILSGASGDITVSYTSSTTITKTSMATLADIVPGLCIFASGQKDASGHITATTVRLSPKSATGCSGPGPGASPRPSFSPRPTPSGQANVSVLSGEVTAVSGVSVTILTAAKISQSITVPTTAAVTVSSATTTAALQIGQCLRATGSRDAAGNVQATALTITPPGPNGTCSAGIGGPGRGAGG
jgi:hypothetical protein